MSTQYEACTVVCDVCTVQCRKYKASEKVRRCADGIYHKFKKLFTVKDGDDFTKVDITICQSLCLLDWSLCWFNAMRNVVILQVFNLEMAAYSRRNIQSTTAASTALASSKSTTSTLPASATGTGSATTTASTAPSKATGMASTEPASAARRAGSPPANTTGTASTLPGTAAAATRTPPVSASGRADTPPASATTTASTAPSRDSGTEPAMASTSPADATGTSPVTSHLTEATAGDAELLSSTTGLSSCYI